VAGVAADGGKASGRGGSLGVTAAASVAGEEGAGLEEALAPAADVAAAGEAAASVEGFHGLIASGEEAMKKGCPVLRPRQTGSPC